MASNGSGPGGSHPSEMEIRVWLISYMSELLDIAPDQIETRDTLASYGLDSSAAVGIVGDLAEWLDLKLDPELLYSYPTIEALARHLAAQVSV